MAADFDWGRALVGFVPGSMGETSVLACLAGAALLIGTGVGSWRIMLSVAAGTLMMAAGVERHRVGDESLLRRESGLAPGDRRLGLRYRLHGRPTRCRRPRCAGATISTAFSSACSSCSSASVNPAYPEGMMLSILFMNLFAPLIDYVAIQMNVRRRRARYAG